MTSISRRNALCGTAAVAMAALPIAGAFAAADDDAAILEKAREVLDLHEAWEAVNRPYDEADIVLSHLREACKGQKASPEVRAQKRKVAELKKPVAVAWKAYSGAIDDLLAMPANTPAGMLAKLEAPTQRGEVKRYLASEWDDFLFGPGVKAIVRDLFRLAGGRLV